MVYQLVFLCYEYSVFITARASHRKQFSSKPTDVSPPLIISANRIIDEIKCQKYIVLLIVLGWLPKALFNTKTLTECKKIKNKMFVCFTEFCRIGESAEHRGNLIPASATR